MPSTVPLGCVSGRPVLLLLAALPPSLLAPPYQHGVGLGALVGQRVDRVTVEQHLQIARRQAGAAPQPKASSQTGRLPCQVKEVTSAVVVVMLRPPSSHLAVQLEDELLEAAARLLLQVGGHVSGVHGGDAVELVADLDHLGVLGLLVLQPRRPPSGATTHRHDMASATRATPSHLIAPLRNSCVISETAIPFTSGMSFNL